MIYFDDLYWRSAGTIGYDSPYLSENDIGPDDAVHDYDGIFILHQAGAGQGRRIARVDILDVAPTVLELMGVPQPEDMSGKAIKLGEAGE